MMMARRGLAAANSHYSIGTCAAYQRSGPIGVRPREKRCVATRFESGGGAVVGWIGWRASLSPALEYVRDVVRERQGTEAGPTR